MSQFKVTSLPFPDHLLFILTTFISLIFIIKQIVSPKKYEQLEDTKKDVELANDEPSVSSPALPSNPPLSILRLVLLTIPFIGIQFCCMYKISFQCNLNTNLFSSRGDTKWI